MELSRRSTIKALGAGAAAWVTPTVLSLDAAGAASCTCSDGGTNFIENPSAEAYTPNTVGNASYDPNVPIGTEPGAVPDVWTTANGFRVVTYGSIDYPTTPPTGGGTVMFSGSLSAGSASPGTATQTRPLAADCVTVVRSGSVHFDMSAYLGGTSGLADTMQFDAEFLDAAATTLATAKLGPVAASSGFALQQTSGTIPAATEAIRFTLTATKVGAAHARNTAAADLLSFTFC